MHPKLEILKAKLAAMNSTFAHYWDASCETALNSAITQGVTAHDLRGAHAFIQSTLEKLGGANLSSRQIVLLVAILKIDEMLDKGLSIKDELYVISHGQLRENQL